MSTSIRRRKSGWLFVLLLVPLLASAAEVRGYTNLSIAEIQVAGRRVIATRVSVTGAARIRDLLTSEAIAASAATEAGFGGGSGRRRFGRGEPGGTSGPSFEVPVPAHSFRVFAAE